MEAHCWIWTWSFLTGCVWAAAPHYSVHRQQISFDAAARACLPGALTTLATESELGAVLSLISRDQDQDLVTFWIGLRKVKEKCVDATAPLRGFRWVQDGSEESELSRWAEEPEPTCLSDRCGALRGRLNGSRVAEWGLVPVKCKSEFKYICKTSSGHGTPTTATPKPGSEPLGQELPRTEPPRPESGPEPQHPTTTIEPPGSETDRPELQPEPGAESQTSSPPYPNQEPNSDQKHNVGPDQGSNPGPDLPDSPGCKRPHFPNARFLSLDPDQPLRLRVECWPGQQVQLLCSGEPPSWHLLSGSPANLSGVCRPCGRGFQPDGAGDCVDVDECLAGGGGGGVASCSHDCVNTLGSYRCTCPDRNGQPQEDPALCSGCGAPESRQLLLLLLLLLPPLL